MFQFYLSSIKSADHFRISQWEQKFQFYLSSIKSNLQKPACGRF